MFDRSVLWVFSEMLDIINRAETVFINSRNIRLQTSTYERIKHLFIIHTYTHVILNEY